MDGLESISPTVSHDLGNSPAQAALTPAWRSVFLVHVPPAKVFQNPTVRLSQFGTPGDGAFVRSLTVVSE